MILAIDPGTEQSGIALLDGERVEHSAVVPNAEVRTLIRCSGANVVACEWVASYGMAVGQETFDTCRWIGRFEEIRAPAPFVLVFRRDVKLHLCHSARAKDANVRQALIDLWGGKSAAIGNSKHHGPLYGVKTHAWAALGVAVTVRDTITARRAAA